MLLIDALNQIIDDGIEAARSDYLKPGDKPKLDGSIHGFEECRGRSPDEIADLLVAASEKVVEVFREQSPQYWFWRCRQAEIEWVANVLSHIMVAQGWAPIAMMTARGGMKAAEIIGVAAAPPRAASSRGGAG
jgi:hypothetical protein